MAKWFSQTIWVVSKKTEKNPQVSALSPASQLTFRKKPCLFRSSKGFLLFFPILPVLLRYGKKIPPTFIHTADTQQILSESMDTRTPSHFDIPSCFLPWARFRISVCCIWNPNSQKQKKKSRRICSLFAHKGHLESSGLTLRLPWIVFFFSYADPSGKVMPLGRHPPLWKLQLFFSFTRRFP